MHFFPDQTLFMHSIDNDRTDYFLTLSCILKTSYQYISLFQARGLMNIWMLKQNGTKEDGQKSIDVVAMAWEEIFIEKIIHNSEKSLKLPNELTMVAMAERR